MYRATVFTRTLAFFRALEPRTALTARDAVRFAMWPIAVMTVLQKVFVKAMNGDVTNDFQPVYEASRAFLNHRAVYTDNFDMVNPHYLYPPSGTLMMAPLAIIDPARARSVFIVLNAIAIVIAGYLLLRLFKFGIDSVVAPILLFAMFVSETVTNTLTFGNINGFVLLAELAFLHLLSARRDLWAGAALGLTIAIKPILAPLLFIALLRGQWKVFVTALGIPVALMGIAWPMVVDPMSFVRRTMPYWFQSRDYYNSAVVGNAMYYGLPTELAWLIRVVFGVLVCISLWLLYRYYREDELFFVCTMSGVLLTAYFLLSSLGQMYYSMLTFPLLMTVVLRNSVMRNWPAWLAVFGFMSFDKWLLYYNPAFGRSLDYLRVTFGWGLLLVVIFAVLGDRYLAARRTGRLDSGIDPVAQDPAVAGAADPEPSASKPQQPAEPVVVEPDRGKPISVET